jgi:hypothetical protein
MTVLLVKETRVVSSQRKPVTSSSQIRVVSSQRKPVTSSSQTRVVSIQRKPVTSSSKTRVVSSQRKPVTSSSQISSQKVVFSTPHHGQESMRIKAIIYSTLTITPEVSGCQVTVILLLPLHQRPVGVK